MFQGDITYRFLDTFMYALKIIIMVYPTFPSSASVHFCYSTYLLESISPLFPHLHRSSPPKLPPLFFLSPGVHSNNLFDHPL